ncbi:hypothetical protein ACWD8I_34230, partial [Micromonospora arida]
MLGGLIVSTHRGLEVLVKAGVGAKKLNRVADAAIGDIAPQRARSVLRPSPRRGLGHSVTQGERQAPRL